MAQAHANHHDYHLVDPSPWPAVGATSAFMMAFGGICWMHHHVLRGAAGVRARRDRHPLHLHRLVARRHPRGPIRGLPHPRGADLAPLRHDPVHRLRGDVLRRLVLGLFQHRAVSRRRARLRAHGHHPRRMAAAGHRDLQSLAPAAAQHADPAHLGHHGDLGASRAVGERPAGAEMGPGADHPARPHLHLRAGLRICACRVPLQRQHLRRHLLHGDRLPRRPCDHRLDLPDRLPGPRDRRPLHARPSISASSSPPGTGISSTWCGCSCSPAYMCGAPACRIRNDHRAMVFRKGAACNAPPFCFTRKNCKHG